MARVDEIGRRRSQHAGLRQRRFQRTSPPLKLAASGEAVANDHRPDNGHAAWAEYPSYWRRALLTDLFTLTLGATLVVLVSPTDSPTGHIPAQPIAWTVGFPFLIVALYFLRGMYKAPLRPDLLETFRMVVTGASVGAIVMVTGRVLFANDSYVAAETVRQLFLAVPLVVAGRASLLWFETRARRRGEASQPTLVVGRGKVGELTARRLLSEPELGLKPIGFIDDAPLGESPELPPVLGRLEDLEDLVEKYGVTHMIIAFSSARDEQLLDLARRGWGLGLSVIVVPRLFEIQGERIVMEHLGGLPIFKVSQSDPAGWQFQVKYAIDRIIAAIALVVLSPILLLAAIGVALSFRGQVLYRQRRVGLDGRIFEMLKFRTLAKPCRTGAEADADWAAEQLGGRQIAELAPPAERSTRISRVLRRSSIDELPQLWNVLRGDMSLIGPRPERVGYVEAFEGGVYRYGERHRVKSGLTGWAQIHGLRGRTPLPERVEWDNHYIENWSLWLDLKIALRTIPCLLRGQGS
jgi:exopolysaccharide biosynthesis polyprenyl glycosylphosphotransferase